jgi:hypothetical protein
MLKSLAASAVFLLAAPLGAAIAPSGPEVVLDGSGPLHLLRNPSVAVATDGHAVVVWTDDNLGLRGRLIDPHGGLGPDFLLVPDLNHPPLNSRARVTDRKEPVAIYDGNSASFYVFWRNEIADVSESLFIETRNVVDMDIWGQRFNSAGAPMGDAFRVDGGASGWQRRPQAARLTCGPGAATSCKGGGIVVAWQSDDLDASTSNGDGIFASLVSGGAVVGGTARISPATGAQNVSLAADDRGHVLALWDADDGSGRGVYGRTFDSQIQPLGAVVALNQRLIGSQTRPAAAFDPVSRNFIAVWQSVMSPDRYRSFGRLVGLNGSVIGGQFAITNGNSEWEVYPAAAATAGGGFTVQWLAWDGHFPTAVRAVALSATGARLGSEATVSDNRPNAQDRVALVVYRPGSWLSTYEGFDNTGGSSINLRSLAKSQ